jgi:ADP-ribose pyrophosphatase YjhB (NUDIX family)
MSLVDWIGQPVTRRPDRIAASVSAAIFDTTGKLLLMHRTDNNFWGLPGGKMEIGESVTRATQREVFEETGLHVDVLRLIGVYSDPAYYMIASYPGGDLVHYVNLCFLCTATSGELRGSEEGLELGFYATGALPEPVLLSHRPRIADALANRGEAFIR